jgi:hypothetical protein
MSLMNQQATAAEPPATAASVHVLGVLAAHLQGAKRIRCRRAMLDGN